MAFQGFLKQSTAVDILIGPFVDDTDGKTAETGLTLDVELSKNGQGLANKNDATTPTHDAGGDVDGYYNCELDATDTNTCGQLTLVAHAAGALPVRLDYHVVEENIYDALYGASSAGFDSSGNVTLKSGTHTGAVIPTVSVLTGHTAQTGDGYSYLTTNLGANGANATEAGGTGDQFSAVPWNSAWDAEVQSECTDALNAYDPPTKTELDSAFTEIKGATWSSATDTLEHIRNKQTDIEADTAEIGAAGAGLTEAGGTGDQFTAIPWNAAWDAEVQSECTDALNAYDPPTKTEMDSAFTEIKGATWASGTDTLEAIRDRGDAAWVTGAGGTPPDLLQTTTIATLASQTSFTLTAGSADDDAYNDQVIIITDSATSTQKAVGTVSDYTGATKTVTLSADPGIFTMAVGDTVDIVAATGAAGSGATAAEVWTYGTRVLTAGTNLNDLSAAQVNAEVDTALADYDGPTKTEMDSAFTEIKGATWSAATDTLEHIRDKQTDIETDTAEIGAAGAGLTEAGGTGDQLTAIPLSALLTTQMTESYAADGVAPTLAQALFMIQQQLGDFSISGTTLTVKKLDGSTTAATFTLDSDTTPTSITRSG